MCPESLINILAVQQVESELQPLRDQGREEEEAEGDYLEDEELLGYADIGVAGGAVFQAALAGSGEGEADEDGDGEEGVDVDEAVEGGDVDAGC